MTRPSQNGTPLRGLKSLVALTFILMTRKQGYSKRRTWRKVHVGICADSGQVIVSAITSNNVGDDTAMLHMLDVIGYHRRSLVETFMFRYKTIVGDRLSARKWQTQVAEVKIKLDVINRTRNGHSSLHFK